MVRLTTRIVTTTMWRRVDAPGHDLCRLLQLKSGWALEGWAVFRENGVPCVLSYVVTCNRAFETRHAKIRGWHGRRALALAITRDASNSWRLNGKPCPAVQGCIDVDINFTPATNLLSLRREQPSVGEIIPARVAWLNFPQARLTPLEQTYRRIDTETYDYRSPSVHFRSKLRVDRHGMVLEYPPLWTQEPPSA